MYLPKQVVAVATAYSFLENDDSNRALAGAGGVRLCLDDPSAFYVGNGIPLPNDSGMLLLSMMVADLCGCIR